MFSKPLSTSTLRSGNALRDPAVLLWFIAALGWLALALGGHAHEAFIEPRGARSSLAALVALHLTGWLLMVVAMMLPTTTAMARMFWRVSNNAPRPLDARLAFMTGYLLLWFAYALLCVAAALAFELAASGNRWAWLHLHPTAPLAASLLLAGLFQFSALKYRCLSECRDPRAFLFAHYRRGTYQALLLGLRHGQSCLGCCWALMLVMLFTGMSNLGVMLVLAIIMMLEKNLRWGARLVKPLGIALLLLAALALIFDEALGHFGLYQPLQGLHLPQPHH